MAGKELKVIITAQDGASRVFTEVSSSAQAAGSSVERAGDQGSAGADKLAKSTAELSREMDEAARAATLVGGAITAAFVAPMMAGATAAFRQVSAVEQATVALRAYETDASKVNQVLEELVAYAQSDLGRLFQREELFAAAQGLRVAGAETENLTRYVEIMGRSVSTGMATWNELDRVLGRIISTGRLTTIEFELLQQAGYQLDESMRNTTVTTEELFDALERGSVTVAGQTETIQGQITMTMSSLRGLGLELLGVNEKSQFVAGGLGYTLVGALSQARDMIDALRPVAGAAGEALGVLAGMASDLVYAFTSLPDPLQSSVLGIVAISGATLTAVGGLTMAIPRIASLVSGIRSIPSAARLAVASITPMGAAAIGLTAAVAAGAIVWANYRREVEDARHVIDSLKDAYLDLRVAADEAGRLGNEEAEAHLNQLRFQVESIRAEADAIRNDIPAAFPNLMEMYEEQLDTGFADYRDFIADLQDQYKLTGEQADTLVESQTRLQAAFNDSRVDGAALAADMDALYWQFMRGEISLDDYVWRMEELSLSTSDYTIAAEEATAATTGLAAAFGLIQDEARGFTETIMSLNEIGDDDSFITKLLKALGTSEGDRAALGVVLSDIQDVYAMYDDMPAPDAEHAEWLAWVNEAEQGTMAWRYRVAAANQAMAEQKASLAEVNDELDISNTLWGQHIERSRELAEAKREEAEALEKHLEVVKENLNALIDVSGYGDPLSRWNLAGNATDMSILAMETQHAATALDTVYRVVVGNTDAVGRQVQGIHDWAEALIGVQGEWSELDRLVNEGRITGKSGEFGVDSEYADAQRAYNSILEDNAAIQDHILTIQAKQSPLIAEHVAMLEEQYGLIADMPAEQALVALGWMDSTTAMRAMEFQTLAVAAATGQLGENGEEVFTNMIVGAAQADPVLKALLIDMGLIEEGADGTITVNLDGAEGAKSEIAVLTDTIVTLIDLLDDGEINGSFSIDAEDRATDIVRTARENLEDADGQSATMELHLNDWATGGINAASWALDALDGRVASTTIRTIYENRGIGPGMALGGVVQEYASGGVVIRAGEVGPEIAHFANGGTALLPRDGLYSVPSGSYITPNHAVSNYGGDTVFNITVNGGNEESVRRVLIDEVLPEFRRATADLKVGMGVTA